jgi:hypothetical protein
MSSRARLTVTLALLCAAPSQAQPKDVLDDARRLFGAGMLHAKNGAWSDATQAFEQAYVLVQKPAVLFNLAGAQMRVGKLLAAASNYTRFIHLDDPTITPRHRAIAERQLARIQARIPRLQVQVTGMRPEDRLTIDRLRIYPNELELEHWVDPGEHTVVLIRASGQSETHRVVLAEGEHRVIPITLP